MPEASPTITAVLKQIVANTQRLGDKVEILIDEVRKSKNRDLWLAIVSFVLVVVMVAMGFVIQRVMENSGDIEAVQTRVSAEALCPMYQLFLNGLQQTRQPYETDEQYAQRKDSLPILSQAYDALDCQPAVS